MGMNSQDQKINLDQIKKRNLPRMSKNKRLHLRKKNLSRNKRSQRKLLRKKRKKRRNLKNLHQAILKPIKWKKMNMTPKTYSRCLHLMIRLQSKEIDKVPRAKMILNNLWINLK